MRPTDAALRTHRTREDAPPSRGTTYPDVLQAHAAARAGAWPAQAADAASAVPGLTAVPPDPADVVDLAPGALVDPAALRLVRDAATKANTLASRPGYARAGAHWQTCLHAEVTVRPTAGAARVWADVHVFGHDGALVKRTTVALAPAAAAPDGGVLFRLDQAVYEGATATPGSVSPRPDARCVQYRLYAEVDGRVVTDGALHEGTLYPDVISR